MGRMPQRFDAEPLIDIVEGRGGPTECFRPTETRWGEDGKRIMDRATEVQAYRRAKMKGYITEWKADELAVKLGYHPCEIWPEWFDAGYVHESRAA